MNDLWTKQTGKRFPASNGDDKKQKHDAGKPVKLAGLCSFDDDDEAQCGKGGRWPGPVQDELGSQGKRGEGW